MKIKKRDNRLEQLSIDKIIYRLKKIKNDVSLGKLTTIDTDPIALKVVSSIYDGVSSSELDEETARIAISMTENLEYAKLASRIIISNLHKNTSECFSDNMEKLYTNIDSNGNHAPILSDAGIEFIRQHKDILNETCDYTRDYNFDYFGFKTLEKSYLMKLNGKVIERPQHLYMRVAIQVNLGDIDNVIKTYNIISQHLLTFASPSMFNSLGRLGNLSSCFLIGTFDSIGGIFKTMSDVAQISKVGGGIGLHIDNIRSKGSVIRGTNGNSDGIIPMLKVYNEISTYVNQCFTPDTWVYSSCGPKQMKYITTDDNLITIDGTFKKVNEVIINKVDKEILEIRATNTLFPVKVTKEHELYLLKDQKKITNYSVIKNRLEKGIIKPDFYNASELTENDLVGFPIPKYELDNDINDLDYYKFYGMMLGDGHICNGRNEYGITLGNETKSDLKIFVKTYLDKHNVHYWECENETECSSIRWSGYESLNLTRDMLYDSDNQKIIKEDFLHLPKNKIMKILEGLLRTDGSNLKELAFINSSQKLIMQMRYLFLRIGVLTSGCVKDNIGKSHVTKHGRTITTKQLSYYLRIPKHPNLASIIKFKQKGQFFKYFEWNGMLWGRIRSINTIKYQGDVYDFNMIDNHNYLTDMGLVHNSGKRKGSFAIYLSPSHPDIMEFLDLRKNQGSESLRARDLFYAMWMPDLFMEQLKVDGDWYLMDPDECPGLTDTYGEDYEKLYWKYVEDKKYRKQIKAQEIWIKILESQIETGNPYILYKDQINKKSNQKNIGVIKSSNLCSEITLYSDDKEYAVCFTGDTQILTKEGYRRIDECNNKEVLSYFNNDKELKENQQFIKAKLIDNGIKDVYELKCNSTKSIKATSEHLFVVLDKRNFKTKENTYKWKKLKDLTKDDKIILPKTKILPNYDIDIKKSVDENYLTIGWMVGDGWQCKTENMSYSIYGVCFGPNETYARDRVIKKLVEWTDSVDFVKNGHHIKTEKFYTDKNKVFNWASSKQNFIKFIKDEYGLFEKTAHYKCIPDKIKKSNPIQIASFLSGLFSADGSVYLKYTEKRNRFYINFASSSKILLDDVQQMLKCFGIESRTIFTDVKNRKDKQGKLTIENKESIINFNKYINFILCVEKQQQLECGLKTIKKRTIFREYTKLKYIKYIGKERVYDLNVKNTHNFIANGFVVHNCNLSSVALPKFIKTDKTNKKYFDHQQLFDIVKYLVLPMNNVIDFNYYPVPETKLSNLLHRPIGIGTQGFSSLLTELHIPFESEDADKLNKEIWETMYFASLTGSMELAKKDGPYSTFKGSPLSEGKFQFDLWAEYNNIDPALSGRWDWETLRQHIITHGVRNSTLLCQMPTASSAQVMNNTESVECFDSCIYKRRVLSGEYVICNKNLVKDLTELNLWNKELKDLIIANNGSVQNIDIIPQNIKDVYKTVWEISMKSVINQAASRGIFICQTQSMNLFVSAPTIKKLSSMHMYAYSKHLKTGMYYLRSKSAANSAKFSIDPTIKTKDTKDKKTKKSAKKQEPSAEEILMCSIENKEACDLCTS